ncbi:Ecr family regulatory small membrane protein [Klebsiella oxytoca]
MFAAFWFIFSGRIWLLGSSPETGLYPTFTAPE